MATVSHTIYSHYDPKEPQPLASSSTQPADENDVWESEEYLAMGFRRRRMPPPQFVPATLSTDKEISRERNNTCDPYYGNDLSSWYRSLERGNIARHRGDHRINNRVQPRQPTPHEPISQALLPQTSRMNRGLNDWFTTTTQCSEKLSPPTLANIISRDPPPLPTEEKFKPPVWLEIGPSNKGFAMLERSGWNEGEALGPDIIRRVTNKTPREMIATKESVGQYHIKREALELKLEGYDGVSELREAEIIDLTLSDSEDSGTDANHDSKAPTFDETEHSQPEISNLSGRTALLTPIATVLKADRLGIGLKAKRVGPYRASQKRVTHNAAAMAAHIRAAEESKRLKQAFGRGGRGYTKQRKIEVSERKRLLAYLND